MAQTGAIEYSLSRPDHRGPGGMTQHGLAVESVLALRSRQPPMTATNRGHGRQTAITAPSARSPAGQAVKADEPEWAAPAPHCRASPRRRLRPNGNGSSRCGRGNLSRKRKGAAGAKIGPATRQGRHEGGDPQAPTGIAAQIGAHPPGFPSRDFQIWL